MRRVVVVVVVVVVVRVEDLRWKFFQREIITLVLISGDRSHDSAHD